MNLTKLQKFGTAAICTIAVSLLGNGKMAQAEPGPFHPIADKFNEAVFRSSGDFYQNSSLSGVIGDTLGILSPNGILAFPDSELQRDASYLHGLYRNFLYQQSSTDPVLRSPDAPNPFNSSLMNLPPASVTRPPSALVPYPPVGQPAPSVTAPPPAPATREPVTAPPVRGRW